MTLKYLNLGYILIIMAIIFLFEKHTHIWGKRNEIREYIHMPTLKLNATVSVTEQVINPFSISHLTDVGNY